MVPGRLFPWDTALGTAISLPRRRCCHARTAPAWIVEDGERLPAHRQHGGFTSGVMIDHGQGRAVAALLSYGGSPAYASRLKQAAQLARQAQIPAPPARAEPWPSWREDAQDAVRALLAGRIAQVHARLALQRREKVSVQQLERAWNKTMPHAAPQADIAIMHLSRRRVCLLDRFARIVLLGLAGRGSGRHTRRPAATSAP